MDKKTLHAMLDILDSLYPETKTALQYSNAFQLLIATILSAQSTDKQVNKITGPLFKKYKTPEDFLNLSEDQLSQEIKGCGLYRVKSRYILKTCQLLLERFGGEVPKTREELMLFPGVGRKTANVITSVFFGKPAIAVDTHVSRLARRLGWAESESVKRIEEELMEILPEEIWSKAHHWLIYHGRKVCLARRPKCPNCQLSSLCPTGKEEVS